MKKLVRDRIPEIFQKSGQACSYYHLDQQNHLECLRKKLTEEVFEFLAAETEAEWLEELADVQEVIHALLKLKGKTFSALEAKRLEKRKMRGGFDKGIFLDLRSDLENSCPFCSIREQKTLLDFERCFVVYDLNPVSPGHVLVIPKQHYTEWFQTPLPVQRDIMETLPVIKAHLDKKFQPDGYNIGFNCGKEAGQTIFHLHVHVIPRYAGDVEDPTGGVRGVIPSQQKYSTP